MINTTEFTERLQKVMNFYDETASGFAEKIGVQRSSISHVLSGRNKPSLDFVMKVLHSFPEVDLYWLMNGKGEFPKAEKTLNIEKAKTQSELKFSDSNPEPLTQIPDSKNLSKALKTSNASEIEKIIIFYKDGSFKNYEN